VDRYILAYIARPGIDSGSGRRAPGYISKWVLSGYFSSYNGEIVLKIRYHIGGGYKYCANVGRHHRSNGVMLDVSLNQTMCHRALTQSCWDAECRQSGFARSVPEGVPSMHIPAADDPAMVYYRAAVFDRVVLQTLEQNPHLLDDAQ
jgi:hypothetical protein